MILNSYVNVYQRVSCLSQFSRHRTGRTFQKHLPAPATGIPSSCAQPPDGTEIGHWNAGIHPDFTRTFLSFWEVPCHRFGQKKTWWGKKRISAQAMKYMVKLMHLHTFLMMLKLWLVNSKLTSFWSTCQLLKAIFWPPKNHTNEESSFSSSLNPHRPMIWQQNATRFATRFLAFPCFINFQASL